MHVRWLPSKQKIMFTTHLTSFHCQAVLGLRKRLSPPSTVKRSVLSMTMRFSYDYDSISTGMHGRYVGM
jgi:hypothetical protein